MHGRLVGVLDAGDQRQYQGFVAADVTRAGLEHFQRAGGALAENLDEVGQRDDRALAVLVAEHPAIEELGLRSRLHGGKNGAASPEPEALKHQHFGRSLEIGGMPCGTVS